jgi:hypothetical protein
MLFYVHVVLTLVSLLDLELEQPDLKKTFLHGELDEDIYMEKPYPLQYKPCEINYFMCYVSFMDDLIN